MKGKVSRKYKGVLQLGSFHFNGADLLTLLLLLLRRHAAVSQRPGWTAAREIGPFAL